MDWLALLVLLIKIMKENLIDSEILEQIYNLNIIIKKTLVLTMDNLVLSKDY